MCGIWGVVSVDGSYVTVTPEMYTRFMSLQARGPDKSSMVILPKMALGFHRLAIMDLSSRGDQPFILELDDRTIYWVCNGEIYDYKNLVQKYNLAGVLKSGSDCEIIGHIYARIGVAGLCEEIRNSEFACAIIDISHSQIHDDCADTTVHLIRDPLGIRPMFYTRRDGVVSFSSTYSGITGNAQQMPPGTYMTIDNCDVVSQAYFTLPSAFDASNAFDISNATDSHDPFEIVRLGLIKSVESMMESDRPMGALLSGGLDSSLVVAIAARYLAARGRVLHTFSIGMPGATDKEYAEMVAKWCGTNHTHIELRTEDFIEAIPDVIRTIESPDITTIRASTGQYLVSKIISQQYGIKVLLIGDGSDELFGGYLYFHKAPDAAALHAETVRLLGEICYYDVLRADRGVAGNGMEARVPYLQCDFVLSILGLPAELRMPQQSSALQCRIEKWLLREAFSTGGYLPREVLYRKKEAFSDGVSSVEDSWYKVVQRHAETIISNEELASASCYGGFTCPTKEALYYMKIFLSMYPDGTHLVPGYWLPRWVGDIKEPSARVLGL